MSLITERQSFENILNREFPVDRALTLEQLMEQTSTPAKTRAALMPILQDHWDRRAAAQKEKAGHDR